MKAKHIITFYCSGSSMVAHDRRELLTINELTDIADRIKDCQWYHSGGGCMHYAFHLDDKRIVIMHTADLCLEVTYDKWESINEYFEIDEDGKGLGWEYELPNWEDRISQDLDYHNIAEEVGKFINKL